MTSLKFKYLVSLFRRLPGVGPRQAARFVIALMDRPEAELEEFGRAVSSLKREISFCDDCFNISENGLCAICLDKKRDQNKLLVVEKVTDLDSVEKTGLYKGLYHVLGGAINPLDGLTPETLRFRELENRVGKISSENSKILELIIATNPNTAGETTSMYIRNIFKNKKGVYLTRLARGLSSGSHLEYADEITLKYALDYRK